MSRKILENVEIDEAFLDIKMWPKVDETSIDEENVEIYRKRERAIKLYMNGNLTLKEIENETGVSKKNIRRLIKRCLMPDNNGSIWGFKALIPKKRLNEYKRKRPTIVDTPDGYKQLQGAFTYFLDNYPEIKKIIIDLYLKRRSKSIEEPVMSRDKIYNKFIVLCREAGVKMNEYPFNTNDLARRSFYRFLKRVYNTHYKEASERDGKDVQRNLIITDLGMGNGQKSYPIRPFEQVQFDGHKIDAIFVLIIITPEGDEQVLELDRIWILTLNDVATKSVLSYHLCFNKEYSAEDVLHCIKNAVIPKKLMNFTIPGLHYPKGVGFHSALIKETEWAVWNELWFDNALANIADLVRSRLTEIIKCAVNAGPVKMPKRRGVVEKFFDILEEYGYHGLPSTTGRSPADPRRDNPVKKAKKYRISVEHLHELTELLVARINLMPNHSTNYLSPLECMQQRIQRKMLPRYLEEKYWDETPLLTLQACRKVVGNLKSGKRPYINYEGVEYRNEVLSRTPELIGITLNLHVNVDDLRVINAFLPDGSELGILTASGKWGVFPHSLKTRKIINKLIKDRIIYLTSNDNPIEIYNNYLESIAKEKKSARNKLAALRYSQKSTPPNKDEITGDKENTNEKSDNSEVVIKGNEVNNKSNDLNNNRNIFKTFSF